MRKVLFLILVMLSVSCKSSAMTDEEDKLFAPYVFQNFRDRDFRELIWDNLDTTVRDAIIQEMKNQLIQQKTEIRDKLTSELNELTK